MAASRNDMYQLSQDPVFQNRVQAALILACVSVSIENSTTVPFHRERQTFASQVLSSTTFQTQTVTLFTNSISTDPTIIADATVGGTVSLTTANRAAQAALVTDAHIDGAIAAQFNDYFRTPSN